MSDADDKHPAAVENTDKISLLYFTASAVDAGSVRNTGVSDSATAASGEIQPRANFLPEQRPTQAENFLKTF